MSEVLNVTGSTTLNDTEHQSIVTDWVLLAYISVVVGAGIAGNILTIVAILCGKLIGNSGPPYSLILNLASVDLLMLSHLAPFEVWTIAHGGTWRIVPEYCKLFLGLDTLLGTVSVYGLTAVSLHNGQAPTMLVLVLVWLLGVSLSVPVFIFAGTVVHRPGTPLCSLLFPHSQKDQTLLLKLSGAIFNVCVPVLLLLSGTIVAALKLCGTVHLQPPIRDSLKLTLVLSLSFAILSLHRSIFAILYIFLSMAETPSFYVTPFISVTSPLATLIFSMLHYSSCAIRPLFYYFFSADIKTAVNLVLLKCTSSCCMSKRNEST